MCFKSHRTINDNKFDVLCVKVIKSFKIMKNWHLIRESKVLYIFFFSIRNFIFNGCINLNSIYKQNKTKFCTCFILIFILICTKKNIHKIFSNNFFFC